MIFSYIFTVNLRFSWYFETSLTKVLSLPHFSFISMHDVAKLVLLTRSVSDNTSILLQITLDLFKKCLEIILWWNANL